MLLRNLNRILHCKSKLFAQKLLKEVRIFKDRRLSSCTNVGFLYSKHSNHLWQMRIEHQQVANMSTGVSNKQALRMTLRQTKKKLTSQYIPGTVNLQVVGSGANGAPCAVYIFTDQSRYLFNCGEGTQRLAHEHKTKLARLEQIFVTRNTWSMIGGLPGLSLTVQDAGVRNLALYGPPHLDNIFYSMKRFVVLKNLQVNTHDCTMVHGFEDAVMTVKCLPLSSSGSENGSNQPVIMYICKLKPRPGTLNLEKCVEQGVPPGPLLGQLKNGKDITLRNGVTVRSIDVSEPCEPALHFIFVDIPSIEYLPALQMQASIIQALSASTATPSGTAEVAIVVHFSAAHMLENNCYINFMETNFNQRKTQHIYLNSKMNPFAGYVAAHRIQYQLNQLQPKIFPLLREATKLQEANNSNNSVNISNKLKKTKLFEKDDCKNYVSGKDQDGKGQNIDDNGGVTAMTCFQLRPRRGLDRTQEAKLNAIGYIQETQLLYNFPKLLMELKLKQQALSSTAGDSDYPKITFLGTGSCIPNKTRNVSAILLQTQPSAYILLDCGEGTLGQIVRFFGQAQANEVVCNLKAIYISHLHADHHIGLIGLLNERKRLCVTDKLVLLAPRQIEPWLNFYDERIERICEQYTLIGNATLLEQPLKCDDVEDYSNWGIYTISTCLVRHCSHSFGVSLTLKQTTEKTSTTKLFKITYSGDTMPCQDLITLGRNSTILIHEATMEDDLIEEAKIKMHSTISQAIQQGREMKAEYIILTHFSQRYAKCPRMHTNIGSTIDLIELNALQNIAIAFDNMQVTYDDLKEFHLLYPALFAMFAEHAEELEQKAIKRELKSERKRKL